MALAFRENEVALTDSCGAEEALDLADWLSKTADACIDLAECTHLHGALLQTLLAYKPVVSAAPSDPFLSRWVLPLLTAVRGPV